MDHLVEGAPANPYLVADFSHANQALALRLHALAGWLNGARPGGWRGRRITGCGNARTC